MDAAQALGNMASLVIPDPRNGNHEFPALALSTLLAFYREAACDPSTGIYLLCLHSDPFVLSVCLLQSETAPLYMSGVKRIPTCKCIPTQHSVQRAHLTLWYVSGAYAPLTISAPCATEKRGVRLQEHTYR